MNATVATDTSQREIVTFTLFFKPNKEPEEIRGLITQEMKNIQQHVLELNKAARRAGKSPPEYKLIYYITPEKPEKTPSRDIEALISRSVPQFCVVEKFVPTREEEIYLVDPDVAYKGGALADVMKTHSIFKQRSGNRPHLQMDTNTQIMDYSSLYAITFGDDDTKLNALLYNIEGRYIAVHNKIVFVPASFDLTPWERIYNDHLSRPSAAKGDKNPIYNQTFAPAMVEFGFARKVQAETARHPRYSANITKYPIAFGLTSVVLPAVHQSWKEKTLEVPVPEEMQLQQAKKERISKAAAYVHSVMVDYGAWSCLVNTWGKSLERLNAQDTGATLMTRDELSQLRKFRNRDVDLRMLVEFCKAVSNTAKEDLTALLDEIPQTPEGKALLRDLLYSLKLDLEATLCLISERTAQKSVARGHIYQQISIIEVELRKREIEPRRDQEFLTTYQAHYGAHGNLGTLAKKASAPSGAPAPPTGRKPNAPQ